MSKRSNQKMHEKHSWIYEKLYIVESKSEETYVDSLRFFKIVHFIFIFLKLYVKDTILGSVKKKVVSYWTDRIMDIRNTTINRVESSHNCLKKYLSNSMSDTCKNWASINKIIKVL